ncbi:DUF2207 domain-containing protein [Flavihumibacter sp. UBA7668]|uniref:DUF2207 domain-containing protein n=1 Tax=Flavihumibacter sp. UBA7668 TaxID=1946542 RepID=UPI0025B99010|nr:DUF2207 domain-containing protein [Flavihumibacter sp. UBA7668]
MHYFKSVCLLIFCCIISICSWSQEPFLITENAARFLSPAKLDSVTASALRSAAQKNQIGPAIFSERYAAYRPRIAELIKSFVLFSYRVLDKKTESKNPEPGSPAFTAIQQQYLQPVQEALTRIIATPASVYPLLEGDESDRVIRFHSELNILASGEIQVTETIKIYNGEGGTLSENDDIKRGIVRDFPTKYQHKDGYWVHTGFNLKSVTKDGKEEPYSTQSLDNGTRIQIGDADILLPKGIFIYQLVYTTNRQLIFHSDRDELYWNVNGNGWVFRFDTVSASLHFPEKAKIAAAKCYTGLFGSTDQFCTATATGGNSIEFQTIHGLNSYEGLTIAADIQKGILIAPGSTANFLNFLRANWLVPVLLLIIIIVFFYNWRSWNKKGRDPKKGVIYPQFEPPANYRPADLGYLYQQQYGSHLFVASLVDAAVHKKLEIEVNKGSSWFSGTEYQFNKPTSVAKTSNASLVNHFGFDVAALYGLKLKPGTYNSTLKSLYTSLETRLKNQFQIQQTKGYSNSGYFSLNRGYLFLGSFLLVAAFAASIIFLIMNFTVPLGIFAAICLLTLLVMQIVFYRIMPAYSEKGREIADHIEGFRLYLDQTEKRVFETLTPPEKTLELFERYLPYAIALKVENSWANQFDEILNKALESGYQPAYFHAGRGFARNLQFADLTRGVSSGLSSTISSSSTPPSSSSGGSRGGGSSGGGGGGGGGGGW